MVAANQEKKDILKSRPGPVYNLTITYRPRTGNTEEDEENRRARAFYALRQAIVNREPVAVPPPVVTDPLSIDTRLRLLLQPAEPIVTCNRFSCLPIEEIETRPRTYTYIPPQQQAGRSCKIVALPDKPKGEPAPIVLPGDISESLRKRKVNNKLKVHKEARFKEASGKNVVNCETREEQTETLFRKESIKVKPTPVKVSFRSRLNVDASLLGQLQLEAAFCPRTPRLLMQLRLKAKQILQRYDLSSYSPEEVAALVIETVGAAYDVSPSEERVMHYISSSSVQQKTALWNKFLDTGGITIAQNVVAKAKSYLPNLA